jgi:basic amino acid/polyamine antiporter, APA family
VEYGSNSELERKLGLFPLTNIVIANMIGAGIFTTSGLLMSDLGNPLLMLGLWVVGGIIALCGALAYGELGAAMTDAGGEYAFLSKLYHLSSNLRLKLSPRGRFVHESCKRIPD